MITGEKVTLERYTKGPPDAMGDPTLIKSVEDIENVLINPGVTNDLMSGRSNTSIRPDGTVVVYTLHIPKGYENYSFRGCRLKVRGEWMEVVGDPTYYVPENTPGAWNYPVEVKRCDG